MPIRRVAPLILAVLATACAAASRHDARTADSAVAAPSAPDPAGPRPGEARVLAVIEHAGEVVDTVVRAPASVRAGEEFTVTVTSFGSGCERAGDVGLILGESSATLMVYDFTSATRPGVVCTMIMKYLPHTATLRFAQPGEATLRVWGRRAGGGADPAGQPVVLERRIRVLPG